MTDVIRSLLYAEPFKPFVIKSSDGQQYRVKHPDYVAKPERWEVHGLCR